MGKFIRVGDRFMSQPAGEVFDKLPGGNFLVQHSDMVGFYLTQAQDFERPSKIYGSSERDARRIIDTFWNRKVGTGVLLSGQKGSGKTMLARIITLELSQHGVPTLLVNQPHVGDGFNSFLASIHQPHCILFDEFEKVYDKDRQPHMLTVLDGTFAAQRLSILTCNDKWRIDSHMQNRPGRIFYSLSYTGLDQDFVLEYCKDNLRNMGHVDGVLNTSLLFTEFNFDILQALVEEMNRYNETANEALRMLNCKPEYEPERLYDVSLWRGSKEFKNLNRQQIMVAPFKGQISIDYWEKKDEEEDPDWERADFRPCDLVKVDAATGELRFSNKDGLTAVLKKSQMFEQISAPEEPDFMYMPGQIARSHGR